MTMPKTAAVATSLGRLPQEWTSSEIDMALAALKADLPGDPIGYIMAAVPVSERCECGALHLAVNAPDLDEVTRRSLHRLLATPFGDIVREQLRRQSAIKTVRFGWAGIATIAPTFQRVVDVYDARTIHAGILGDQALGLIIKAIRKDLPGMMAMYDESLGASSVVAVGPQAGDQGRQEWKRLIDQVMFAFSTPLRKYLDEYAYRHFNGARVGAVNCCIVMSDVSTDVSWSRRWFDKQVAQQLTPDC